MYTYSIGATLLVPVFLASMSAASLTDCIPSQDEGDFTAAKLECRLPDGQQPKFPDDNHKTCHRTCITEIFFGLEICTACITDVNNEPIEVVAPQDSELQNIFTNRVILSPNFPNEFYPESILCRYIVQCDKEQLLWYYITDHDLQGRVNDPINNNQPTCVDFLCINRTAYNAGCQRTCGDFTTIEDDNTDYNDDRLSVLFHTNRNRQNRGFFMVVTCVSPDFSHVNGCTPAQLGQTAAPSGGGRRKRVTEMEEKFKAREKRFGYRVPCIRVPTDAAVSYENNIVRVVRGGMRLYTFPRIRLFHVSNHAERFLAFTSSAKGRVFPGFGVLEIGAGRAFFIQEGVEPQFRPSAIEEEVIFQLWRGVLTRYPDRLERAFFRVNNVLNSTGASPTPPTKPPGTSPTPSRRPPGDFPSPSPRPKGPSPTPPTRPPGAYPKLPTRPPGTYPNHPTRPPGRSKRQWKGTTSSPSERARRWRRQAHIDVATLSSSNVNACNPVLRANACAVQEIVLNKPCEPPPNSRK